MSNFLPMFSEIVMKKLLKESAKIMGLDSTLFFIFIDLIYLFEFSLTFKTYLIPKRVFRNHFFSCNNLSY